MVDSGCDGPHWVEVRGLVLPRPVGGHPALDFVNTLAGWGEPAPSDFLRSYDHLAVFAEQAGLLDPRPRWRRCAVAQRPGHATRTRCSPGRGSCAHGCGPSSSTPADRRAVGAFSRLLQPALAQLHLEPGPRPTWDVGGGLDRPLSAVAWAGAQALTGADLATVHACPGHECGWLFLDPRGRRRWCSMRSCGNRAKVAAHAERQRADRGPASG